MDLHVSATKDKDGTFKCPSCRQTCIVPKGGVSELPKNFFASNLLDIVPSAALRELESMREEVQCKHSGQQAGPGLHGDAVVFCTQCDAYLCDTCVEAHKVFDPLKGHNLMSVNEKERRDVQKVPRCHHHPGYEVNWYCKRCEIPACSECILENHSSCDRETLSVVAERFRGDLQDVSGKTAKHLAALDLIARDPETNKVKMEEELDRVDKDITEEKEAICKLVEERAQELRKKVETARKETRKNITEAVDALKILRENSSKIKLCAQALCTAQAQFTFRTAVQAPNIKEQFLRQQQVSVSSVAWNMDRQNCELGQLSAPDFMGTASMEGSNPVKMDVGIGRLGRVTGIIPIKFDGFHYISCIAPIYSNAICVTHYVEEYIWVYTDTGELRRKFQIPGVRCIWGMVMINGEKGQLALVDGTQSKVHLVTLSSNLKVVDCITKDASFAPECISITGGGEVVVCRRNDKRCAVLTTDGEVLHDIQLNIPGEKVSLQCVTKLSSGYLVCEYRSRIIFFTSANGDVLSTSNCCKDPLHPIQTFSRYVLISD